MAILQRLAFSTMRDCIIWPFRASRACGIASSRCVSCNLRAMNATNSREVIWGGRVSAAKINAEHTRKRATEAVREADRAEAHAWSLRMEGFSGPAQPSPTIAQCLNGGYGRLEVKRHRCETRASIPLDAITRPRNTPIWKLARGVAEVPIMSARTIRPAGSHDQAGRTARGHAVSVGTPG
jgi:hypothetical protein